MCIWWWMLHLFTTELTASGMQHTTSFIHTHKYSFVEWVITGQSPQAENGSRSSFILSFMPFINFRPITAFICASLIHFSHTIHYTSTSVIHFSHMCSFLIPSHILPLSIHLFIYSGTCSLELHNARGQFGNTPKSIHLIFCTLHLSFSSLIPLKKNFFILTFYRWLFSYIPWDLANTSSLCFQFCSLHSVPQISFGMAFI